MEAGVPVRCWQKPSMTLHLGRIAGREAGRIAGREALQTGGSSLHALGRESWPGLRVPSSLEGPVFPVAEFLCILLFVILGALWYLFSRHFLLTKH